MTTSEPTTGEIAVFIPMKKSKAAGIFSSINLGRWTQKEKDNAIKTILCAPVPKEISKERMSDVIKFLADRLESQERELSGITGELERFRAFHERYAEQTSKKYIDDICALTARAESAERERDSAISDLKNAPRCSVCDHQDCKYCTGNDMFTWRGLQPQEGE